MAINNLIANPYVAKPVTNYLAAKRDAQQGRMNEMSMRNTSAQMGRANQEDKLKTVARYMKGVTELDYHKRANELFTETGIKSPKEFNKQRINNILEQQGMLDEVKSPTVKVLKYGDDDILMTNGTETARTKTAVKSPLVANNIINEKGDNKYWEERLKNQATTQGEVSKRAEASYNEMRALDRFLESSKDSTEGGAQPIISGVKNFLTSFGAEFEGLEDIAEMEQAIGDIKVNFFKEFGARGLTDKDMEIIKDALPRINTSRDARENVVGILKKAHAKSIEGYEHSLAEERRVYPEQADKVFTKGWYNEYLKYTQEGDDLTAEEKAELETREMLTTKTPRTN